MTIKYISLLFILSEFEDLNNGKNAAKYKDVNIWSSLSSHVVVEYKRVS